MIAINNVHVNHKYLHFNYLFTLRNTYNTIKNKKFLEIFYIILSFVKKGTFWQRWFLHVFKNF